MVVSLGPGKFYGTSLPRPRFYTDVKFNDHRIDPPLSVNDPLMSWAQEAHWSMGGLSFKRLRLQGKIEGNVDKLRSQREKLPKAQAQSPLPQARSDLIRSKRPASDSPSPPPAPVAAKRRRLMALIGDDDEEDEEMKEKGIEEDEDFKVVNRGVRRRRLVKKLGEEFDRVASENEGSDMSGRVGSKSNLSKSLDDGSGSDSMALRTRSRRLVKGGEAVRKVVGEEVKKLNPEGKKSKESDGEKSPVSASASASSNAVRTSPRLAKRVSN